MEIIKFLLSFFFDEFADEDLNKIYKIFEQNSFDVKNVLKNLKPDMLAPFLKTFLRENKKSPDKKDLDLALKPIAPFADREILNGMKILM